MLNLATICNGKKVNKLEKWCKKSRFKTLQYLSG